MKGFFKIVSAAVAGVVLSLVFAASALAFSHDYCEQTNRGQAGASYGAYAGDNDIKWVWDNVFEAAGYNIVSSRRLESIYTEGSSTGGTIRQRYGFYNANGTKKGEFEFYCGYNMSKYPFTYADKPSTGNWISVYN